MGRLLFLILAGYAATVAIVFIMQRSLQYFPHRDHPGTPGENGLPEMQEIAVKAEDGLGLIAWFAPPAKPEGKIVVFFHGNAGHIGHRAIKARHFLEKGFGVYFCEYRGYGPNKGRPTEEGLYMDARAAFAWLEKQGYGRGQFAVYGESIGSGPAVHLAREIQPAALILEAPFDSAVEVAKAAYFWLPVSMLMKDRYDNISKISDVKSPLLIVHGDEDGVISMRLSQKLFEAANHPKQYVTINGGNHNDLYEHHAGHIITDWLEKQ